MVVHHAEAEAARAVEVVVAEATKAATSNANVVEQVKWHAFAVLPVRCFRKILLA